MATPYSQEDEGNVLYTLVGSQFGAKALVALDALGVPYVVQEVDISEMKTQLEPPHTVPQMRFNGKLLTDSSDILKAIDAEHEGAYKLYPEEQKKSVEELEAWAGNELNMYVFYFCWWVQEGFQRTYRRKILEQFWPLPTILALPVAHMSMDIGRMRGSYRKKARNVLGEALIAPGREAPADEEGKMRASLIEQIHSLEARFATDDQKYICGTASPTAADFTLYAILERLVGNTGDSDMGAGAPWLWNETQSPRLQAWHAAMLEAHPIVFKSKA